MEDNILEGLKYDGLILNENVHKIVGKLSKLQNGQVGDVDIDERATWLVTGLGYLNKEAPDKLISESLNDTIIISKTELAEFIKRKISEKG